MLNCCNCPGDSGQLLGPVSEALASSLLSIKEAINCVTAACFNTSSLKMSLYSIWLFLMFVGYMVLHFIQCS